MLSVAFKNEIVGVIILNVIKLNDVILNVIILNVIRRDAAMLNVNMLNDINCTEYHNVECR